MAQQTDVLLNTFVSEVDGAMQSLTGSEQMIKQRGLPGWVLVLKPWSVPASQNRGSLYSQQLFCCASLHFIAKRLSAST